jgi:cystathionine beta-lyase
MDFELAPPVREALLRAVELGDLGYIGDVEPLLEAMRGFYARRLGWELGPVSLVGDVIVGLTELLHVHTQPGDGVIVNPPCYPPYFFEIPHAGRRLVEVPLLDDAGLDLEAIDGAFAAGARVLLLCTPHNPTGRVYTRSELVALAEVADRHGALVIADEIHAPLSFVEFTPWLTVSERGFALESASKAFNLPALKLGFVVGEPTLDVALRDHAGHLGVLAAEAAFRDGDEWLDETIATIAANQASLPSLLPDGVVVPVPAQASYLAWLDFRGAGLGDDPAAELIERGRVALTHGAGFGAQGRGFARLNVGTRPELVREAVRRMASALAR